jgi:hypothetical protein
VQSELALIAAFLQRSKRDRYREILSNPRLRHKFTHRLAHFPDFDPKYRVSISSNKLSLDSIAIELKKRQCPDTVWAISEDPQLDQREIPLLEALRETVGRGVGTILSCIPGRLALVETEDERFILQREDLLERCEYIRFVVGLKDGNGHSEQGIFRAVMWALEWKEIQGSDAETLRELLVWFSRNLAKPSYSGRDGLRFGICWFKVGAVEHMLRIDEMSRVLERNGVYIKKIKTDKPGYVIYEDEWQLVAEPIRKN